MKRAKNKSNIEIVKGYLAGERPFTQVGWVPDFKKRKEGETWTDAQNKSWIFKGGRKKRVNKSVKINPDDVRLRCKDCQMDVKWGNYLDDRVFYKSGRCYDCLIKFETKLKRDGEFRHYEQVKIFKNQKGFCLDLKGKLEDTIKYLENSNEDIVYINEDGSKDVWKDTTKGQVLEDAKRDYQECLDALVRIDEQLEKLKKYE